jgi:hypothetical protein
MTSASDAKRALRVSDFCRLFGIGRSKFYVLVERGEIRPVKSDKVTLIPISEGERWLASLPPIGAPRRRGRSRRGTNAARR